MANDPILSESFVIQAVAPSCALRNVVSDETGHLLIVGASSWTTTITISTSSPAEAVSVSTAVSPGAVSVSTVSAIAMTTNTNRKGAFAYNEGVGSVLVSYSTLASSTNYVLSMSSGGYWEMPPPPIYVGSVAVIAATSGGVPTMKWNELS